MQYALTILALAGLSAVYAAPMPKPSDPTEPAGWTSLWNSQISSMVSVQSAMGGSGYAQAEPTPVIHQVVHAQAAPTTVAAGSVVQQSSTHDGPAAVGVPAGGVGSYGAPQPDGPQYSAAAPPVSLGAPAQPSALAPAPAPAPAQSPANVPQAPAAPSSYTPPPPTQPSSPAAGSGEFVSNPAAFSNGAACHDPLAAGPSQPSRDSYQCFGQNYPSQDTWASFDDLWTANQKLLTVACTNLGSGADNTAGQSDDIKNAILSISGTSLVDPRFIMAVMMQESHGCVNVGTTSNGVTNPGLMQSHNGVKFNAADATNSITQMIKDGVTGTSSGDGLVQLINQYGDPWKAARAYNSGSIAPSGNLNDGNGATASYVMDVANRLRGWSMNPGTAPTC